MHQSQTREPTTENGNYICLESEIVEAYKTFNLQPKTMDLIQVPIKAQTPSVEVSERTNDSEIVTEKHGTYTTDSNCNEDEAMPHIADTEYNTLGNSVKHLLKAPTYAVFKREYDEYSHVAKAPKRNEISVIGTPHETYNKEYSHLHSHGELTE